MPGLEKGADGCLILWKKGKTCPIPGWKGSLPQEIQHFQNSTCRSTKAWRRLGIAEVIVFWSQWKRVNNMYFWVPVTIAKRGCLKKWVSPYSCVWFIVIFPISKWVCLKIVYPYTQWLMIIIPRKNGYFIGNIPYFQTNPSVKLLESFGLPHLLGPWRYISMWHTWARKFLTWLLATGARWFQMLRQGRSQKHTANHRRSWKIGSFWKVFIAPDITGSIHWNLECSWIFHLAPPEHFPERCRVFLTTCHGGHPSLRDWLLRIFGIRRNHFQWPSGPSTIVMVTIFYKWS